MRTREKYLNQLLNKTWKKKCSTLGEKLMMKNTVKSMILDVCKRRNKKKMKNEENLRLK